MGERYPSGGQKVSDHAPPSYPTQVPREQPSQYLPNSPHGYEDAEQRIGQAQQVIPMLLGGPPYLPPLTKGQKIKTGPYTVTVTDSMVLQREHQNREIYRAWIEMQQRATEPPEDEYHAAFKNIKVRRAFVKKVFFLLFLQFLFTSFYISFFMFHEPANIFIKEHWYLWVFALIIFMTSYCTISLSECGRQQSGWGGICLILLTLAESHLSAYVTVHFDVEIMLITMGLTASVSLILTIAAACCKFDCTKHAGLLGIFVLVCTISIFVLIFTLMFTRVKLIITIIGILGALVFSLYLYFDIQTIMGGRKLELSPNEVIFATTQLYVDIMGLYRYLLMFMSGTQSSS
ncbi:protein lifeguard 2-like [Venturia canescens]|uniref:protein lifeguard 2-like n=1 Tax=Venturia canescens TaxID=32260 RepID=UPI001C9C683B|nr:protein lifeguard 2-like [Venturia canescens]XP_043269388.1 protein lifeguard 2-like [Venturia canescens]XP_043269395.1 protein lifeguard 2-like [Venturia canescens]XP_043269405.1 protein lifeguard 2-like [Venturia canescens]